MPYCCQCGTPVGPSDTYCAKCGGRQPGVAARVAAGLTPRGASILCYIPFVGWIAAIVVLASEKFRQNRSVRFHAFQGLYLFVAYLIVHSVVGPFFRALPGPHLRVDKLLDLAILGVWIFMIIKTSQQQTCSLPILGELAEKSVSES
ncbi:MAG: hypothetical protein AAB225_13400 [Acidobacteriota bacterium]